MLHARRMLFYYWLTWHHPLGDEAAISDHMLLQSNVLSYCISFAISIDTVYIRYLIR